MRWPCWPMISDDIPKVENMWSSPRKCASIRMSPNSQTPGNCPPTHPKARLHLAPKMSISVKSKGKCQPQNVHQRFHPDVVSCHCHQLKTHRIQKPHLIHRILKLFLESHMFAYGSFYCDQNPARYISHLVQRFRQNCRRLLCIMLPKKCFQFCSVIEGAQRMCPWNRLQKIEVAAMESVTPL